MENDPTEGIKGMTPYRGIMPVTPTEGIKGMTPYRGIKYDWQDFAVTPTEGIREATYRWKARGPTSGKPEATEGIMGHRGNYGPPAKLAIDRTEGIMYGDSNN